MQTLIEPKIRNIKFGTTDVFLENFDLGQGKITISDTMYDYNYSYYWGAMGQKTIEEFICETDKWYFTKKLIPHDAGEVFDNKKTFAELRKFLKQELPFYEHMEFQKDLREKLRAFQEDCDESAESFFYNYNSFVDRLDFYFLIKDKREKERIEKLFNQLEIWEFICKKDSRATLWLHKFHEKLVTYLKNEWKKN